MEIRQRLPGGGQALPHLTPVKFGRKMSGIDGLPMACPRSEWMPKLRHPLQPDNF